MQEKRVHACKEAPMLKRHTIHIIMVLVTVTFLVSGCRTCEQSRLEESWGSSFQAARSNQIVAPDRATDPAPVTGLDGSSATTIVEKYRGNFKKAAVTQ